MLALTALFIAQGCSKPKPQEQQRAACIIISGDTQGWIVPCGCTANQSGGLLRRGAYLRTLRSSEDVLYFDVGGAGAGDSHYQQAKLQAIFAGEVGMQISAHNLGASEISLGSQRLREIAAATGAPLLSANATSHGQPLAPAMRIFPLAEKRLGVIGVVATQYAAADITVDDPRQAILTTLAQYKGQFDTVLILAYLPDDQLQQLAASTPEADAVIGGPTGQTIVPRQLGPTLLASATNKGKFLIRLDPPVPGNTAYTGQVVEMDKQRPDDDAQSANLQTFLNQLRQRDFTAADSGFAPRLPATLPGTYRIAGSMSCVSCHASASTIWQHSLHFQAVAALRPRKFEVDPDCLHCHTTGYGYPGGFDSPSRSAALASVGCESCHGPSLAHVADPRVHTPFVAADQCVRCHDTENSPAFDQPVYWKRIVHAREAAAQPAGGAP